MDKRKKTKFIICIAACVLIIGGGLIAVTYSEQSQKSDSTEEVLYPDKSLIDYGNAPSIIVSDVTDAKAGKDIDIQVSIKNNPGILGMSLTISYDESVLSLKSASSGQAMDMLTFTQSKKLKNGCTFLWDGVDISDDDVEDGEILNLTFHVKRDAEKGKYPVIFVANEGGTVDASLSEVALTMYPGYIYIN